MIKKIWVLILCSIIFIFSGCDAKDALKPENMPGAASRINSGRIEVIHYDCNDQYRSWLFIIKDKETGSEILASYDWAIKIK